MLSDLACVHCIIVPLTKIFNTVQDDLLARVIFGEFACGKLIGEFYIGHMPLSVLRLKQKWWILYWQFLYRTANINSLPINHLVRYTCRPMNKISELKIQLVQPLLD